MNTSAGTRPAFIIGGAPRSGTTFLCHALDRHPDIFIAKPFIPEPKVFMTEAAPAEYLARYRRFFSATGSARFLGEKTSYYLESEAACERIRAHVPEVKLVFIVREPVARAYSNYLWSRMNGLETLAFAEAVALEGRRPSPLPEEKSYARPFDYLTRGDYARFAERYYAAFGRERVAFFLYEDIEEQPDALLLRLQQFIGVEPLPDDRLRSLRVNSARESGPALSPILERELRTRMAPLVTRFAAVTGLDVSRWGYGG